MKIKSIQLTIIIKIDIIKMYLCILRKEELDMKKAFSIILVVATLMLSLGTTVFAGVGDDYYYYSTPNNYVVNIVAPTTTTYVQSYKTSSFSKKNVERFAILSTIPAHGTTTATPQFGQFNETVEVVLYPDDGYSVATVGVYTISGQAIPLYKGEGNTYYFAMPAEKVVVDATYAAKMTIPVVTEKEKPVVKPSEPATPAAPAIPVVPEKVVEEPVEEVKTSSGIWVLLGAVVVIGAIFIYKKKKGNGAEPLL